MEVDQIRQILVVGAGTMGCQIGLQCAMHGYDVMIYDIGPDILENSMARVRAFSAQLVAEEHISQEAGDAALARVTPCSNPTEAAAEADLLSESVPEDPQLKGQVFALFNKLCPPRTIFSTNTSTLVPSMFAEATGRPAQFAALHFHTYVWNNNLVDIMPHPGTSGKTVKVLRAFARRIGQIPIILEKENSGYVFNAMYEALNSVAISLARTQSASIEDIDRAWMIVTKAKVGPFGALDHIGIDTAWHIAQYWAKEDNDPEAQANAEFLKDYVDKGWLGVKSGRGFYIYPEPAYQLPEFLTGESNCK